jgi:O-antigen ligase
MLAPIPFFRDHTIYAAVLVASLCLMPTTAPIEGRRRWLYLLPALALVAASSRAAWLSLLGAAWLTALITKPRLRPALLGLAFACIGTFYVMQSYLRTDVSSLERLNRWQCAWRMAADKPLTGFGPGTFMFEYFDYQRPEAMTRISITKPLEERGPHNYGRGGGVHSEYLQALVETGWPGAFLWLFFVIVVFVSVFRQPIPSQHLFFGLALLTFLLHGLVNNFLHDARMALVFWGIVAAVSTPKTHPTTHD